MGFTALPKGWEAVFEQEDGTFEMYPIIGLNENDALMTMDGMGQVEAAVLSNNFAGVIDENGPLPGSKKKFVEWYYTVLENERDGK